MDSETTRHSNVVKRDRKANFGDVEVRMLLDLYQLHRPFSCSQLAGTFSNIVTQRHKTALWQESVVDVRKKWADIKRAAQRKELEEK